MQAAPLSVKIKMTARRIRNWVDEFGQDGVYVSFSGGKDSTVLVDIVRNVCGYQNIPLVFVDVPTQYPELKEFVLTFDNIVVLKPKISFAKVCEKYGFPIFSKEISECVAYSRKYIRILTDRQTDRQTIPYACYMADLLGIDRRIDKENKAFVDIKMGNIPSEILKAPIRVRQLFGVKSKDFDSMYDRSKYLFMLNAPFEVSNQCCKVMKKQPLHQYNKDTGRVPITAQMACESKLRTSQWLQNGCNGFDLKIPTSNPMSFWTEQDVLLYIKENNLPICSVYGDIVTDDEESGQMTLADFCDMEGFELDRPHLHTTGCSRTGCVLCGFGCHLEKDGQGRFELLKKTHPKFHNLLYILKNNGVTYAEAIDWINEHGDMNIKY
jgi:3'-phosphoadenosine 5'-phosphosulfate sulfotransferase (PAPS reductase)/FAD synthetase